MDMKFMDEYYEGIRADNIETLIKQNSDEWESCEKQLNKAWDDFLNGLGIAHIFYKEHKLSWDDSSGYGFRTSGKTAENSVVK